MSSFKLSEAQLEALRGTPVGVSNRLRIALALAEAKQVEIAKAAGIRQPNLSDLVRGRYGRVTTDTAGRLADVFGCQIEDLFPRTGQGQSA